MKLRQGWQDSGLGGYARSDGASVSEKLATYGGGARRWVAYGPSGVRLTSIAGRATYERRWESAETAMAALDAEFPINGRKAKTRRTLK